MRILVSLNFNPKILYKKDAALKGYLKEKLELEYSKAIKKGFKRKIYGLYISATKAINDGNKKLALRLLDEIRKSGFDYSQRDFEFGWDYKYENYALLSVAEDTELFLRLEKDVEKNGVRKLYVNYDKSGEYIPEGVLLDVDLLKEIYEKRFVAVA